MRMPREIRYRVDAPASGRLPGEHRSALGTSGIEYRGHAALLDAPDPRRLDLLASLRDPFGTWRVRVHKERRSVPVTVVADLSASMGFRGDRSRLSVLADLVESLAWSAWRSGDSFGFLGCDTEPRSEWWQPQSRARGTGIDVARRLRGFQPLGRDAGGLLAASSRLGRRRALLFLVSDFHLPMALIGAVVASLGAHEVVPVVLWDEREFGLGAARGLVRVQDPETARQRLLWWRPALRADWLAARGKRRAALSAIFRARRLRPLFLEGGFDADAVARHFYS